MSVAELEAAELALEGDGRALAGRVVAAAPQAGRARRRRRSWRSSSIVAIFAPLIAPYDPRAQDLMLVQNGCCPGPSLHALAGGRPARP